jgi:hypothetical protein
MSKSTSWAVIIIILLAGMIFFWFAMQSPGADMSNQGTAGEQAPSTATGNAAKQASANTSGSTSPAPAQNAPQKTTTAGAGGTSDASLDAGLQNIDSQMQSADDAGASSSSFNDSQVAQTE